MKSDETKDVFSLAMHSMQVIGALDVPASRASTLLLSPGTPAKRKPSGSAYQPSPKKPPTVFTKVTKKDDDEEIDYDIIPSRTMTYSGSPDPKLTGTNDAENMRTSRQWV